MPPTAPHVWLASYPRSGNTWLRILLKQAFGLSTMSLYGDRRDIAANRRLADLTGHQPLNVYGFDPLLLIKTHDPPRDRTKAIYVIRDGRAVVASYFRFAQRYHATPPDGPDKIIRGEGRFGSWSGHVRAWNPRDRPDTLLLRFERMTAQPDDTISQLAGFLGRQPSDCRLPTFEELKAIEPRFFNAGNDEAWKALLTDEQLELFWSLHGGVMREYGYG